MFRVIRCSNGFLTVARKSWMPESTSVFLPTNPPPSLSNCPLKHISPLPEWVQFTCLILFETRCELEAICRLSKFETGAGRKLPLVPKKLVKLSFVTFCSHLANMDLDNEHNVGRLRLLVAGIAPPIREKIYAHAWVNIRYRHLRIVRQIFGIPCPFSLY